MTDFKNVKLGNSQIAKVYLGENLVWNYVEPDLVAPTTTIYPTPTVAYGAGAKFWFEVDEACDTYYTLDGTTPTVNSTLFTEPFILNSTTIVKYFSVDVAGNVEAVKTTEITITATPVTTISPASTIQNTIPFTVSLSATNNPTAIYYRLGNGTQQTYTAPFEVNQSSAGVGSPLITITYWSVNANGTEAEKTITYDTKGAIPSKPVVSVINGENSVTLNYAPPTLNTTSYSIYRSEVLGVQGDLLYQYWWDTTYTDNTAIGGTTYYYTVISANYWNATPSDQVVANPIVGTGGTLVQRTLKPTALWSTNMTPNNVAYLQDSPDSVDANSLVPTSTTVAPYAEVYFGKLTDEVLEGTQKIRLSFVDDVNWVGLYIDVYENGVLKQSFSETPSYNGYNNLVAEFNFDASIITDKTGINVAIMVRGVLFNGTTIVSLRAIEWVATVRQGAVQEPPQETGYRYLRIDGYGESANDTTRMIEVEAYVGETNVLLNKAPLSYDVTIDTGSTNIATINDGTKTTTSGTYPIWWSPSPNANVVFDFGTPQAFTKFKYYAYSTAWEQRINQFKFMGSNTNNGTDWVDLWDMSANTTPQPVLPEGYEKIL